MKTIELNVEKRSTIGKNEARRERATGKIPAVLYGSKKPTISISVDRKALTDAFRGGGGENAIFLLKLAGTDRARHVMIKELQQDPVSRKALHIDFVRIEIGGRRGFRGGRGGIHCMRFCQSRARAARAPVSAVRS